MGTSIRMSYNHNQLVIVPQTLSSPISSLLNFRNAHLINYNRKKKRPSNQAYGLVRSLDFTCVDGRERSRRRQLGIIASTSNNLAAPSWDSWRPEKGSKAPPLSDVLWPSAGAFAAMALLGKMDQMLAAKGLSMTIAPFGAVCAVLYATPSSPGARKYNMFMAQIGCAAIGVLAFAIFGPGWLARSAGLALAIAFMTYTRSIHPPAASLPLLFIDGAKLHHLNFWYALFPGAAGCILLCLIQEVVCYLKDNFKF